jgi:hypothetical protein
MAAKTSLALGALPDGLIAAIAGFVGLGFLRVRGSSRQLSTLDGPCLRRTLQLDHLAEGLAMRAQWVPVMRDCDLVYWASLHGYLLWAQWGAMRGSRENVYGSSVRLALSAACRRGHLPMARWLVMYFDIKVEGLRSYHYDSLQAARDAGFDEVVSWMTTHFELGTGLAFGLSRDAVEADIRATRA